MGVNLDGANDYINLGSDLALLNGQAAATLTGWLLPNTLPGGIMRLISIGVGPPPGSTINSRICLGTSGAFINTTLRHGDGDSANTLNNPTSGPLVTAAWQHLALTYDCVTKIGTYYYNGVSLGTQSFGAAVGSAFSATNSKISAIGTNADGTLNQLDGKLADIRVYKRVLSASEIQTIYTTRGADGIIFGLQSRYQLDEGAEGVTISSAPPEIRDSGPTQSANGSPANGPTFFGSPFRYRRQAR